MKVVYLIDERELEWPVYQVHLWALDMRGKFWILPVLRRGWHKKNEFHQVEHDGSLLYFSFGGLQAFWVEMPRPKGWPTGFRTPLPGEVEKILEVARAKPRA